MVQHSTASETDACVVTPIDDCELLDFGAGRKLERWGEYLVEYPDRLARGEPACRPWSADWIYVDDVGTRGHWEPTRSGLLREWTATVAGLAVLCHLDERGRVGLRSREFPCAEWIRKRIEGCFDLEDIRMLNLFAGNGYVTAQAVRAGASVVHVDASAARCTVSSALTRPIVTKCADASVVSSRRTIPAWA